MSIGIVEAPTGTIPSRHLSGRFGPETGALLLHLAPRETQPGAVALALLQAMGKDVRVAGGNTTRTSEHRTYAPVWVKAHGIESVALLDAQQARTRTIATLLGLLPEGTDLVLVCEPGHLGATRHRLESTGLPTRPLDWTAWLASQERATTAGDISTVSEDAYDLSHLPVADFLLFRYRSRELNTRERFEAIDADYVRTYQGALTVRPEPEAVIAYLDSETANAVTTASMMVALRATQSAFFSRGHLLHAHPDRLLGVLSCNRGLHPTDKDWRALGAYIRPERSATTALYLLGIGAQPLPSVTVEAIDRALDRGVLVGRPIPSLARPLLAAQLLRRIAEGARPGDSYLNLRGERRHLEVLIDARRDLGLPIDGRNLRSDHSTNSTRVLHRLGLDVRSL
ncbi:hypothetical protein [Blastococcus sp. TF02A-30]|uniref:hypothetical protein n=1 Tax=Blastococcus sp. TF02A-30 TaxID=2250580 RepID=UPI000DEB3FBF|nr:hypothetical protein [Blastococcus sp. TF02A-30]RBY92676.1 hypothetical protein DQ241_00940 [Blastococcus sp. TF02A-30]